MKMILNIEPKPQSRPRFARRGNFTTTYEDKDMKIWKNKCRILISKQYANQQVLEGALRTSLKFFIKPPQYISKVKRNKQALTNETILVSKKADLDNYIKSLLDSANGILYKDDGQIAEIYATKVYSESPRIELEIEEIE
ncbi:RusA family crossover junction endodeoxyribonuclease [Streptococcus thermophilus]|uniref:RusA family crossover junction endodeoxyribonuclease n=1 Tax=Streptococcus thermophilus TaxID=1308 RepID=UPI003A7F632B